MRRFALTSSLILLALPCTSRVIAAVPERLALGSSLSGADVTFTRTQAGWAVEIGNPGLPQVAQPQPAQVEVSEASAGPKGGTARLPGRTAKAPNDLQERLELHAAYSQVKRTPDGVQASATLHDGAAISFLVQDLWQLHGKVVSVARTVTVRGSAPGGFSSNIGFLVPRSRWSSASYLAPGVLYADPNYDGVRSSSASSYRLSS